MSGKACILVSKLIDQIYVVTSFDCANKSFAQALKASVDLCHRHLGLVHTHGIVHIVNQEIIKSVGSKDSEF